VGRGWGGAGRGRDSEEREEAGLRGRRGARCQEGLVPWPSCPLRGRDGATMCSAERDEESGRDGGATEGDGVEGS